MDAPELQDIRNLSPDLLPPLLWVFTKSMKFPREFQIRGRIATPMNKDSLLDIGTNAGKTLCIVLPCFVSSDTLAVVFSPLKRLQAVQVLTFEEYGIIAIAISEETPDNSDLWKVCSHRISLV